MSGSVHIGLAMPGDKTAPSGNSVTAERWAALLGEQGFRVSLVTGYQGEDFDALIAIHAWRSRQAIQAFRRRYPRRPLLVLLAGTDINHYLQAEPMATLASLDSADRLIGLHGRVHEALPQGYHHKLRVIYQSAPQTLRRRHPPHSTQQICVFAHLRAVKDPLRAAEALRRLEADSALQVHLYGDAETDQWRRAADQEMARNPRFYWHGSVPGETIAKVMAEARAMVISSLSEGGANVVSEACRAGLPVIASAIPGNLGLLGDDHPATFPAGDTEALALLLDRCQYDAAWLSDLEKRSLQLAERFHPERERNDLMALLAELGL